MTRKSGVRAELLALQDDDGLIRPKTAVNWARRHKNSDLYAEFEWDDKVAGELHRIDQARKLISIFFVEESGTREFVSLSIDRVGGGGYRQMSQVMKAADYRTILLQDALNDLDRMRHKYHLLSELAAVWAAADAARSAGKPRAARKSSSRSSRPRRGGEASPAPA